MTTLRLEERKILAYSRMRAHYPAARLAKDLGIRTEKVRRVLSRLEDEKYIFPYFHFEPRRFGLKSFQILLAFNAEGLKKLQSIVSFLKSANEVKWVCSYSDEYDLGLTMCVRDEAEIDRFLSSLIDKLGPVFSRTLILREKKFLTLEQRFLYPELPAPPISVEYSDAVSCCSFDLGDLKIANALFMEPLATLSRISRAVGLPLQTVHYRVQRLTSAGVLMGCGYFPNYDTCALCGTVMFLKLTCVTTKLCATLEALCVRHPHITGLGRYAGAWDFQVRIEGCSSSEIARVRGDVLCELGSSVRETFTLQIGRSLKSTLGITEGRFTDCFQ